MNSRYYGLDLARAVFMLLGLVYHVSMVFRVDREWRVTHEQQSSVFNIITHFLHGFRMDGFYLLSGFFFLLIVEKYGEKKALLDRLAKLGVPMLVVGFTLNTVMNYLSVNFIFDSAWNYIVNGRWLAHLWFLGNLIGYCTVTVLFVRRLIVVASKPQPLWLLIFVTFFLTPTISVIGTRAPNTTLLFLSLNSFFIYLPFFLLGLFLYAQKKTFLELLTLRNFLISLILSTVLYLASDLMKIAELSFTLNMLFIKCANTLLAIGLIALFNTLGNKPSTHVSKLVNSSYSIYLLHMPLIVIYQHALQNIAVNVTAHFLLLLTLVFTTSFYIHQLVIQKSHTLLFLLNGKYMAKNK